MKLLLKTRRTQSSAQNVINIGKTTISFKGTPAERMFLKKSQTYCSLGLDDDGNLCIFYSNVQKDGLLKVYKPKETTNYYSISINGVNREVIKPYIGNYEISEIKKVIDNNEVKQAVLRKIS